MTKSIDQLGGRRARLAADRSRAPQRVRGFELTLDIEVDASAAELPVFLRIARAIAADIRRGRLLPGARLPGSRVLSQSLHVHRNTVLAAYRELLSEGWIEARHGRGTFVSAQLPEPKARGFGRRPRRELRQADGDARMGFAIDRVASAAGAGFPAHGQATRSYEPGVLRMFGGLPDLRLVPRDALARAHRRALRSSVSVLGYADAAGHPRLRAALAGMLRQTRGVRARDADILVTRGSQMAITLVAQSLLAPADVVAVEAFGYAPAWSALRQTGARLVPVSVDAEGLCVAELAELCERGPVRAVYLTPHHQYPTTVPLSPARRLALLALAERKRVAVIEDDYDHEFHYEGRPLMPLKSVDAAGCVVYVGTLSKVFAPGLRMGYVVAPGPLREEMTARRSFLDRQGDHATELALAELIDDGELARHTRRTRRIYQRRRELCVELLHRQLSSRLTFQVPSGGMALWARVRGVEVGAWLSACERSGVAFQPGQQFRWDGAASDCLRLGFACLNEDELREAVRRLARGWAACSRTRTDRR